MNAKKKSQKILICDDDEIFRVKIAHQLQKYGYKVVGEAKNGRQAKDLFVELHPDIILLDINMPMGNGLDVLHSIRYIDPSVRIVMLTGVRENATSRLVFTALEKGANDYLIKNSYDKNRFLQALGESEDIDEFSYRNLKEITDLFQPDEE